jgi:hypothetical protein
MFVRSPSSRPSRAHGPIVRLPAAGRTPSVIAAKAGIPWGERRRRVSPAEAPAFAGATSESEAPAFGFPSKHCFDGCPAGATEPPAVAAAAVALLTDERNAVLPAKAGIPAGERRRRSSPHEAPAFAGATSEGEAPAFGFPSKHCFDGCPAGATR